MADDYLRWHCAITNDHLFSSDGKIIQFNGLEWQLSNKTNIDPHVVKASVVQPGKKLVYNDDDFIHDNSGKENEINNDIGSLPL